MVDKFKKYPIELPFPDLSHWKSGNCGVDYIFQFKSNEPGKHAMIMSLIHGNEISGALVVDRLLRDRFKPRRGTLTLGFANVAAYEAFSADEPDATRFLDEDMNRVWNEEALDGSRDSLELRRARALRPIVDQAELLLDLHSMHEADPPIMMGGYLKKGEDLARAIGVPEYIVMDKGHKAGKRLRDYGGFGDPSSDKTAILFESGHHFEKQAYPLALDVAARFLLTANICDEEDVKDYLLPVAKAEQKVVDITEPVTIKTNDFRFADNFTGMQLIKKAGTIIAYDGTEEIRTPYDNCILVQPTMRHARIGATAVRLGRLRS